MASVGRQTVPEKTGPDARKDRSRKKFCFLTKAICTILSLGRIMKISYTV